MIVYELIVHVDWEGWTESIHATKTSAWRAGRKWLFDKFMERYEWRYLVKKSPYDFKPDHSFRVVAVEIKD